MQIGAKNRAKMMQIGTKNLRNGAYCSWKSPKIELKLAPIFKRVQIEAKQNGANRTGRDHDTVM